MSKKQKRMLLRILTGGLLFAAALLVPAREPLRLALYLLPYFIIGGDVLWMAARNIIRGQIFDENFLMALATVGAFCIGEYPEGVAVMLFYRIGELFESYAVGKSRKSIAALMDIRPDSANIERNGVLTAVSPEEVAVGDIIVVKPGERIPLDGMVIQGQSAVNTAALTGESLPREVKAGDAVISGCVCLNGLLKIRVEKVFGESTVARILDLVENASAKKAKAEHFISRFARYYTPVVVASAAVLAVVPSLLWGNPAMWIERALIFLVISCPCALVISVPLSFFGGIGGASRRGILVKGGNYLEALARIETVVLDKTGTLTRGSFSVTQIHSLVIDEAQLLELAALCESGSDHPISRSIRAAYGKQPDLTRVSDYTEIAGEGVRAHIDGNEVYAGNLRLMERAGVTPDAKTDTGTAVHLAVNSTYAGYLVISDTLKPDAAAAMIALKKQGVRKLVMLTGDTAQAGEEIARQLGMDEVYTDLLPADKVAITEQLLASKHPRSILAFVGDGINDAPVLARADVGIAMGALGADAAIEAADVVLMDDCPSKIAEAITIARRTLRIVRQNIVFALGVKVLVLLLGAIGMANMWWAVFADVGVLMIAVANATRALNNHHLG